ncbi:MAG: DNA-binding protein [Tissierellia bacterium]|nr:DNA-binding protein [Tissierellia bacterium]
MVERIVEIGILFDFYGKLLSERQYVAIELYYIHDLSLAEISEELGISRQGVYDILKRAEEYLYEYETRLGLVNKFRRNKEDINRIYRLTEEIEKESEGIGNESILIKAKNLKAILNKMIENS